MAEPKGKALLVKAILALLGLGVLTYGILPEAYCSLEDTTVKYIYMSDSHKTVTQIVPQGDNGWDIFDNRCQKGREIGEWIPINKESVKECKECPKVQILAYTDNGKYFCDEDGCIKDNSIEMPVGVI